MDKKVVIACDHRGILVRDDVHSILSKMGYECVLCGSKNLEDIVDYSKVASAMCNIIDDEKCDFGVIICGTGVGACMACNKHKNIRAVLADSLERVYFARRHEDANVLVFAGGYSDGHKSILTPEHKFLTQAIIEWTNTKFEGDRHIARVEQLNKFIK